MPPTSLRKPVRKLRSSNDSIDNRFKWKREVVSCEQPPFLCSYYLLALDFYVAIPIMFNKTSETDRFL